MTSPTTDRRYGVASNVAFKAPCDLATTGNITLTGEQSIDGTTTSASRVLVKDQTDASENGIYLTDTGDWTRDIDFNGNRDAVVGTLVCVNDGTTNADTIWKVADIGTIDTDDIDFESFVVQSTGTTITAGNGIVITGTFPNLTIAIDPSYAFTFEDNVTFEKTVTHNTVTITNVANHFTPDASASNYQEITLTANATLDNPTNLPTKPFILNIHIRLTAGPWTLAFGSMYRSQDGTALAPLTAGTISSGSKNFLSFEYNPTDGIFIGALVKNAG